MAYPTTINYLLTSGFIGFQPIHTTSTVKNHPLGTIVRAADAVYGEGEFIYAKGVGSTAQGDFCTFNTGSTPASVRAVTTSMGPGGIAMSANVLANYGWYQISGAGVVLSVGVTIDTIAGTSATPGSLVGSGATVRVDGLRYTTAQDAPGAGYTGCQLNRPCCNLDG
jgi:hypothetical protein